MTKKEMFKSELYSIAKQALEIEKKTGENTTYTSYIMDNMTERTEKTYIKENIDKLEKNIPRDKKLGINTEVYEKMLQICNDRLKRIKQNEIEFKEILSK